MNAATALFIPEGIEPITMPRYLTKSRFILAKECETKLFYTGKEEYADHKKEDPFLAALAEGGFQVGELAKLYYPGGHEIETLDHEKALEQTKELLQRESVILYEAAIRHGNLFLRADILIRKGNDLKLIEVKSKSFGGSAAKDMLNRNGTIGKKWVPYLYDVAFQKHVLSLAFPEMRISAFLLLADKNARTTVNGLNQRFLIYKLNGRPRVRVREGTTTETLGEQILIRIPVDRVLERIYQNRDGSGRQIPFSEWLEYLAENYLQDRKIQTRLGSKCRDCEFRCTTEEESSGLKSGFKECWREQAGLEESDFSEPLVIHLWNSQKKDSFLDRGIYFLRDIDIHLLQPAGRGMDGAGRAVGRRGLSIDERQALQVEKARSGDPHPYFDAEGLQAEMENWIYPLHFIDFETSAVAIPFSRGMTPYEGVAFQYSHHRVDEDGGIAHAGQYLHTERGQFPSFDFLRALKKELEVDEGTIFRYADHENTYLNIIYRQLREADSREVPDRVELCEWITTVSHPTVSIRDEGDAWFPGSRDMVDQRKLVERYFYHPATGGSNSLKKVLPAVLESSVFLQEKYSRPLYGRGLEIPSLNFEHWSWIRLDETGTPLDPYKLLPPIFEGAEEDDLEHLVSESNLADGAAAMIVYARMQFSEMGDRERQAIQNALLKYCELDTLAMVMLWEYWVRELMAS